MALTVAERIAQTAEHFANHNVHGYSQPNRGTGGVETITLSDGSQWTITASDVDCSEMVRQCVNVGLGGKKISYMWTGDEDEKLRAQGFTRMTFATSKVKRGDVLWVKGHTGVALGNGKQADAHGDEVGGITGPKRGDQTGHEVEVRTLRTTWTYIYRYASAETAKTGGTNMGNSAINVEFTLSVSDTCNVRSAPSLSASVTGQLGSGDFIRCDRMTQNDGRIWAGYVANSGNVRWVSLATPNSYLNIS